MDMMYVVVATNSFCIYGPFASFKAAAKWREQAEKDYPKVGFFIRQVISPTQIRN